MNIQGNCQLIFELDLQEISQVNFHVFFQGNFQVNFQENFLENFQENSEAMTGWRVARAPVWTQGWRS